MRPWWEIVGPGGCNTLEITKLAKSIQGSTVFLFCEGNFEAQGWGWSGEVCVIGNRLFRDALWRKDVHTRL